jgi:hypothetical protein
MCRPGYEKESQHSVTRRYVHKTSNTEAGRFILERHRMLTHTSKNAVKIVSLSLAGLLLALIQFDGNAAMATCQQAIPTYARLRFTYCSNQLCLLPP